MFLLKYLLFYVVSHMPEIILMGLFRNRFLRQKEGNYNVIITLAELMSDYSKFKFKARLEEGGSSFIYS